MNKPVSRSEEKRASILAAAKDLFSAQGFTAITMDQIAKAAGVSKQTVYSHFGNKDDLFAAAIEQKCIALMLPGKDLPDEVTAREALEMVAVRFTVLILSDDSIQVHRTCVSEALTNPEVSRIFYQTGPSKVIHDVSVILAELAQRGLLSIDDPHFAALQFLYMLHGEARMHKEYNIESNLTDEDIQKYTHSCIDMFLRAYAP
ncbi:TetR/AcrR family transcriptional regulator [Oceanospirillum sediminis]|uniref:TetR/AcrR family transcriptional regulator n=1 Tax=Oceanospirillum sediminis TaxID=2760088 RepID=A0A839IY50_9GAMM|nr:TetR/AcrR family transcriptional regulator [Oceanospirillum sediminis]MBB1489610.1 TetR/AcrR family transcriptional regulator [Oceanospirillum sediminis]